MRSGQKTLMVRRREASSRTHEARTNGSRQLAVKMF
jgi:hypothetical protein